MNRLPLRGITHEADAFGVRQSGIRQRLAGFAAALVAEVYTMCGIAGCATRGGVAPVLNERRGAAVLDAIRHRGPDAAGQYAAANVWLGHVRLSIIDVSEAGNQPMQVAGGNVVIIYNGEVYNFREIAEELALDDLHSHSDTEVVARAFEKIGAASFSKLNGIFAFALYDRKSAKLWLVRDRLGVKPLYYRLDDRGLFFGSEIKTVVALSDSTPRCDISQLREWLYYGNVLGGDTLYSGIQQLLPGHYAEVDLSTLGVSTKPYWSLPAFVADTPQVSQSTSTLVAETRRLLDAAVRRQLVSDVPVGVFLSGGVDSSAITAFASKYYGPRLTTWTAGFENVNGGDERPKARRVAEHFGTDHHELYIPAANLPDLVEKMVRHHDLPFSDSANIPLYLMAAQISGTTKVVLQGDGGDEVFGGYRRYVSLRYRSVFRMLARLRAAFDGLLPDSFFSRRVRRYLNAYASDDVATTIARLLTPADPESRPESLFGPLVRSQVERSDPFARYRECEALFHEHDIGARMSLIDMMVELPDIFLEKVDRATMAASLEVRVPFLDNDLVEYVARVPGRRKMPWGKKKWLLKQALKGIVPHDVLYGPKTGFNVPFDYWLRTSLKALFFDHLQIIQRRYPGFLDAAEIGRRFAAMEEGRYDNANTLWNVLNLMIWCNYTGVEIG